MAAQDLEFKRHHSYRAQDHLERDPQMLLQMLLLSLLESRGRGGYTVIAVDARRLHKVHSLTSM